MNIYIYIYNVGHHKAMQELHFCSYVQNSCHEPLHLEIEDANE